MPRLDRTKMVDDFSEAMAEAAMSKEEIAKNQKDPEFWKAMCLRLMNAQIAANESGQTIPNFDQTLKGWERVVAMHGFDPKRLQDHRSPEQIVEDAIGRILEAPESVFEQLENHISLVEEAMNDADEHCKKIIRDRTKEAEENKVEKIDPNDTAYGRSKKKELARWRELLARVRRLRERARYPVPPNTSKRFGHSLEAAHPLRYMAYVGRSNIPSAHNTMRFNVFRITPHLCEMTVALWEAVNWVHFSREGPQRGVIPYEGAIIVAPPGHWKSELVNHWTGLRICLNPKSQMKVVHAVSDRAKEMLKYASAMFSDAEPVGRRCRAVFHDMPPLARYDNNASSMRLDVGQTLKAPTLQSGGMYDSMSGVNASEIVFDDPVDEEDAYSPTERDRTYKRINNTWKTRLRGEPGVDSFHITVCTIWHEDDAVSRNIELVRKGKSMVRVKILRCGGPEDNFKPVCEYCADRRKLRDIYARDPNSYKTIYMVQPQGKAGQIISKLALYDPTGEDHQKFMNSAVVHASIDPAASNRPGSDKAGVVYAAHGSMGVIDRGEDGAPVYRTLNKLRVIGAEQMQASPLQVIDRVAEYSNVVPVDYVHVETVNGYHTMADAAEMNWNISAIRHDPTGKGSKEQRLRRVASLIDAGNKADGVQAAAEFPGVWNESGELVIHPDYQWISDEILRFGAAKSDDGVDALTQLVQHLSGELTIGRGRVAGQMKERKVGNEMKRKMIEDFRKTLNQGKDHWGDDASFMRYAT